MLSIPFFDLPRYWWKNNKGLATNFVIISVILLLALGLRLFFYVGMGPRDDIAYIDLARDIQTNNFHLPQPYSSEVFPVRMMIYLPVFFSWKLFGMSEFTSCLYFIFCSLLLIVTGYFTARILYGPVEGIIIALILCLIPLDVVFSSQIMPDMPQAALGSGAVLFFLIGRERQRSLYFILSGIAVAFSLMSKEFALIYYIILLFFVVHSVVIRDLKPNKALSAFSLIIGSSFIVLFLFWLPYLAGNIPWAPVEVILNNAMAEKNANPDNWYYFKLMFNLYHPPWSTRYFGIFYYLLALSLVALTIKDFRRSGHVLFWFLSYLFFIQWLGPWLSGRAGCERAERFLIPLSLPAGLIIARSLGLIWRVNHFAKTTTVIIVAILLYSLFKTTVVFAYPSESIHLWDLKRVACLLPRLTPYLLYTDRGSAQKLNFLTSYELPVRGYFPNRRNFDRLSKCWVAFDLCDEAFIKKWIGLRHIPDNWTEVFHIRGPHISHFKHFDARIYWVP